MFSILLLVLPLVGGWHEHAIQTASLTVLQHLDNYLLMLWLHARENSTLPTTVCHHPLQGVSSLDITVPQHCHQILICNTPGIFIVGTKGITEIFDISSPPCLYLNPRAKTTCTIHIVSPPSISS